MKTTKSLLLAGFAVLSLGVGSAMAQSYDYALPTPSQTAPTVRNTQIQSGASDVTPDASGADHSATFILNHQLFGAGGVAG
jgi:hypothetical protein